MGMTKEISDWFKKEAIETNKIILDRNRKELKELLDRQMVTGVVELATNSQGIPLHRHHKDPSTGEWIEGDQFAAVELLEMEIALMVEKTIPELEAPSDLLTPVTCPSLWRC